MRADYTFSRMSFSPRWSRPAGFLEVGLGGSRNGATLLRFSQEGVEPFFVSRSGIRVPIPKVGGQSRQESELGCSRYEVVAHEKSLSISCSGSVQLEVPVTLPTKGFLFVRSSLLAGELGELSVIGKVGGSEVEDRG